MDVSMNILKNTVRFTYNENDKMSNIDLIKPNNEEKHIQEIKYEENKKITTTTREDGRVITEIDYIFSDEEKSKLSALDVVYKQTVKDKNHEITKSFNKFNNMVENIEKVDDTIIKKDKLYIADSKEYLDSYRLNDDTNQLQLYEKIEYGYFDNNHNEFISKFIKNNDDDGISDELIEYLIKPFYIKNKYEVSEDAIITTSIIETIDIKDKLEDSIREFRHEYSIYNKETKETDHYIDIIKEENDKVQIIKKDKDFTEKIIYTITSDFKIKSLIMYKIDNKDDKIIDDLLINTDFNENETISTTYVDNVLRAKTSTIIDNNSEIITHYIYENDIEKVLNKYIIRKFQDGQRLEYSINTNGNLDSVLITDDKKHPCIYMDNESIKINSYDDKYNLLNQTNFINLEQYSKAVKGKLNLNVKNSNEL